MERHEILEAMSELKLYGMRASFDEIAGKGLARRDEIYPLIASLIRAERTHRQARSISYRIGDRAALVSAIVAREIELLCAVAQSWQQRFVGVDPRRVDMAAAPRVVGVEDGGFQRSWLGNFGEREQRCGGGDERRSIPGFGSLSS